MTAAGGPTCSLTFVGNATMVLRFGPLTLLTDPNFLHRGQLAYLGHGLASRRLTDPALTIEQLPQLDAILLSHMHGDHWDRVAKRGLDRSLPVLTTPKAARALVRQGFRAAHGLSTWDEQTLQKDGHSVRVTAVPGRHGDGVARLLLPPVMGSVLDYTPPDGRGLRVYITGDTLFINDLRVLPTRFPDIDVAVLHLGGTTLPGGLVVTMDAGQGADLLELVRPTTAIPMHHSDYGVFKSPLSDFEHEVARRGLDGMLRVVAPGETATLVP